jgi:two-component system chemotaxis response regulator CheY
MRSLIVEDDPSSRLILESILGEYGSVDLAATGIEGYEMFASMRSQNTPYDLVCLDILLPGMSGQEVLRDIRAMEESDVVVRHTARIVMITALDDKTNVISAFRGQCDAYIVKPIQPNELRGQLAAIGVHPVGHAVPHLKPHPLADADALRKVRDS